ncbi:MAG: hypothetical protein E6713_07695 [Sporomusaceae bacterium]|nr:hypothetical protein [Sporomusaceae bacterium]
MSGNITEELIFETQIHKSYSNREQRMALRPKPRRVMTFDYIALKAWQSQYLRQVAYAKQTEAIKVPLWFAAYETEDTIPEGATMVNVSKEMLWQYRDIGNVVLWYSDEFGGNYYKMRNLAIDGTIQLDKRTTLTWPAKKTIILPVAWATLKQEGNYNMTTSVVGDTKLSYEFLVDYDAPEQLTAYDEYHDESFNLFWGKGIPNYYKGYEVFMTPPSWTKDIASSFSRNAKRLDNDTGIFKYDLRSNDPSETLDIEYVGLSRPEINNLQRFFTRCRGCWKSFYAPSWFNDFELLQDALPGQQFFYAKWPLYFKYYTGTQKKTLAVFLRNGEGFLLEVAGYAMDSNEQYGKIYLDSVLKRPLKCDDIQMISFLNKYRHDNDTMTTDYDSQAVATTSFKFAEVID